MKLISFYSAAVLAALVATSAYGRDPLTGSEALTFTDGSSSLQYRLYRPAGWDAPGANFPVVLFLHGAGERGSNNTSHVSSHIQGLIDATASGEFAAYLIAPQVPSGQQWTDVSFGTGSYSNPALNSPIISNPLRLTLGLMDQFVAGAGVDESRVYITGLSMGGYGTFDAIARRPDLFAAALPLSGGGNLSFAETYSDIPLWAFHGAVDPTVPASGSRNTINAIESAGGTQERYTELADKGHVIWSPIYDGGAYTYDTNYTGTYATEGSGNVYSWMFA
ncbi:MAG: hypothetical protein EOP84_21090, partial [Verrucomicrobiaceae bacterium]